MIDLFYICLCLFFSIYFYHWPTTYVSTILHVRSMAELRYLATIVSSMIRLYLLSAIYITYIDYTSHA